MMSTRFLPLREGDTPYWALLTCPYHTAGDVALKREGAFAEVRCRQAHVKRSPYALKIRHCHREGCGHWAVRAG
jgi:hypothetical protein